MTGILDSIRCGAQKVAYTLDKHSPTILVVVGSIGVVTSAVMACKATLKAVDVVDEAKEQIDIIHEAAENGITRSGETYSEEDHKKDLTIAYVQNGVKLLKIYAPSIVLGTLSLASIVYSHNILSKRNMALAAAYVTVDEGFKEYRNRVVDRFGREVDRELRYNIKAQEIEETIVNEDGSETKVKKTIKVIEGNKPSMYAKFFDESSRYWKKNPEYNAKFLIDMQRAANDKLKYSHKGFVLLNEVYEMLDIEPTQDGMIMGWIYDKNAVGDQIVFYDPENHVHDLAYRNFVNGIEPRILLDFNVQCNVYKDNWQVGLNSYGSGNP